MDNNSYYCERCQKTLSGQELGRYVWRSNVLVPGIAKGASNE